MGPARTGITSPAWAGALDTRWPQGTGTAGHAARHLAEARED